MRAASPPTASESLAETRLLARLSFDPAPSWHVVTVAAVALLFVLLLASRGQAGAGVLPTSQFTVSTPIVELGQPVTLRIEGQPGQIPVVLGSLLPGPTLVPRVGTLGVGFGAGGPFFLFLPPLGPDGKVEITGATQCGWPIAGIPVFLQAVTLDAQTRKPASISAATVLSFATGDCGGPARGAVTDGHWSAAPGPAALRLPGLATDLDFLPGAQFVERADGTARLLGVVARAADPTRQLVVDLAFSGRLDPGDEYFPPGGSPVLDLFPDAYWPSGPVRPATWHYYAEVGGSLVGAGGWAGGRLAVSESVTDVQVGAGANGRNANGGAWGRLHVETLDQPAGSPEFPASFPAPGELALDLDGNAPACVATPGKAAFWLPGLSTQLAFLDGATFAEADGGATLDGVLVDGKKSGRRLRVAITFGGLVNPGAPAYPPPKSPWLDLKKSDYADAGGPVDPATWHYYTSWSGTLVGEGDWDGAVVEVQATGSAFQAGFGANGATLAAGASGHVAAKIVSQPKKAEKFEFEKDAGWMRLELGTCP